MTISSNPYRGFRFPREVIEHAVWLYHCFSPSLRDVELILAARGIVVSYESIREWGLRFGRIFANVLRQRRLQPGDKWYMDEVFIRIRGKQHHLWRAVDQERDHEYKRHGTVTLMAGIDLLTGTVHALVEDRHRSREFIEFLKILDTAYPAATAIKIILDNHTSRGRPRPGWPLSRTAASP
jgi:hypothetical protein